ncbi:protein of unknown function [Butyrivibrio fibrisolvens DSM 3071]|uniref:DUF4869 domain-containing protein n=1 Tax=Butyrivibrio fibrisolvens DSM 3071 TaxID=1121131 RepID=A0A1M6DYZ8_BUTFI|nr:DUF4869 domain-containing protein [Butyrivibrio fibrisolvens]SHI78446.1 protein of unknown function [Butyrivibrio fibrisolvens DSM 3071]
MLNIFYGDMPEAIYNTSAYFKFNYEKDWITEPRVADMIKDVDSSTVLGTGAIDSPVLGVIAPINLSGGVKTLILIDKVPDKVFNASNCGDNCAHWLLEIAKDKDVTINLRHIMKFKDEPFEVRILNDDVIVTNMKDLIPIAGRYV